MAWEVLLRPVGPEPAAVYWRRRAAAISAVILVIVLFSYACSGGGGKKGGTGATVTAGGPRSSASPTASRAPGSAVSSSTPACAGSDLAVTADMSASTYPSGAPPVINVTVVNNGGQACTLDVGPSGIVAVVTSGPARVWSNADCGTKTPNVVVLSPGVSKQTTISWNRFRSDPECKANVLATKGDAGTYVVSSVTVAGKTAAFPNGGNVFTLS